MRQTGGHLGSSLGVVELTTALLHVFGSPDDKIVYDVGHQAYVHKMLTGRRRLMPTIRQTGGISGATAIAKQLHQWTQTVRHDRGYASLLVDQQLNADATAQCTAGFAGPHWAEV